MPKLKTFTLLILLIGCLKAGAQARSLKPFKNIDAREKRVLTLLQYVHSFYFNAEYNRAVYYADKAKAAAYTIYNQNAKFDEIGLCRYRTEDYKGAIADFNKFISRTGLSVYRSNSDVLNAIIDSYLKLKHPDQAAKYCVIFGGLEKCQQALMLCKQSGNKVLYRHCLDSAFADFKRRMDWATKAQDNYEKKRVETWGYKYDDSFILNYACLYIMDNKPTQAIEILQKRSTNPFSYFSDSSQDLLTSFANYLTDTSSFDKVAAELKSNIEQHERISSSMYRLNFGWFNQWLLSAPFTPDQREHLMQLNAMAKK